MDHKKQNCKYWDKCYQRNPEHLAKYKHPTKRDDIHPPPKENKEPKGRISPKRSLTPPRKDEDNAKKMKKSPAADTSSEAKEATASNGSPDRQEMDISKEYKEVMENLSKVDQLELFQRRVRYSQKAEYADLLKDPVAFIRHKFLVEMPLDFYKFWEFCESQAHPDQKPQTILERFGLKLVGPFDYLAGNFQNAKIFEPGDYLRHWRFFYDPPEFQTVFVKQKSGIHFGYWRDDPKDKEDLLMARNNARKDHEFEFIGGNCFETVLFYLDNDSGLTPFNRQNAVALKKSLQEFAAENKINISSVGAMKNKRSKNVVCKMFHGAGLVVPFDRKTEIGYRCVLEAEVKLKNILKKLEYAAEDDERLLASVLEDLQPLVTAANIAVDECDFGAAIELGIDLFCSGHKKLHKIITGLLVTGYSMIDRPQFIAIIKSHLDERKNEIELSILD